MSKTTYCESDDSDLSWCLSSSGHCPRGGTSCKGSFYLDSGKAAGLQAMLSKVFSNFQCANGEVELQQSYSKVIVYLSDAWVLVNIMIGSSLLLLKMRQKHRTWIFVQWFTQIVEVYYYVIVMVCHFVCNTHKVMIALIVVLPWKWCCACFPGIL